MILTISLKISNRIICNDSSFIRNAIKVDAVNRTIRSSDNSIFDYDIPWLYRKHVFRNLLYVFRWLCFSDAFNVYAYWERKNRTLLDTCHSSGNCKRHKLCTLWENLYIRTFVHPERFSLKAQITLRRKEKKRRRKNKYLRVPTNLCDPFNP